MLSNKILASIVAIIVVLGAGVGAFVMSQNNPSPSSAPDEAKELCHNKSKQPHNH